jgi:hypothetical protein
LSMCAVVIGGIVYMFLEDFFWLEQYDSVHNISAIWIVDYQWYEYIINEFNARLTQMYWEAYISIG